MHPCLYWVKDINTFLASNIARKQLQYVQLPLSSGIQPITCKYKPQAHAYHAHYLRLRSLCKRKNKGTVSTRNQGIGSFPDKSPITVWGFWVRSKYANRITNDLVYMKHWLLVFFGTSKASTKGRSWKAHGKVPLASDFQRHLAFEGPKSSSNKHSWL